MAYQVRLLRSDLKLFGNASDRRFLGLRAKGSQVTTCDTRFFTWVDRVAGHSVARAYAGHSAGDTTDFYTSVGFSEIVNAHGLITGTIHPTQIQE